MAFKTGIWQSRLVNPEIIASNTNDTGTPAAIIRGHQSMFENRRCKNGVWFSHSGAWFESMLTMHMSMFPLYLDNGHGNVLISFSFMRVCTGRGRPNST